METKTLQSKKYLFSNTLRQTQKKKGCHLGDGLFLLLPLQKLYSPAYFPMYGEIKPSTTNSRKVNFSTKEKSY